MIECFGAAIAGYRKMFKINQTELGKIMLCSRITINTIEKVDNVSELPDVSLFRLYFFLSRAEADAFNMRSNLFQEIENEIERRMNSYDADEKGKGTK